MFERGALRRPSLHFCWRGALCLIIPPQKWEIELPSQAEGIVQLGLLVSVG